MVKFSNLQAYVLSDSNREFMVHLDTHVHVFRPVKTSDTTFLCLQVNNLSVAFCLNAKCNL
jgi:hypothetical protein